MNLYSVLNEILSDKDSEIFIDEKNYKKTHSSKIDTSRLEFISNNELGIAKSLSVGSKKLNINLKVLFFGQVIDKNSNLKLDAKIYKDFTLVRNGLLYIDKLIVKLSDNLLKKFSSFLVEKLETSFNEPNLYVLDLTNFNFVLDLSKFNLLNLSNDLIKLENLKIKKRILSDILEEVKKLLGTFNQYNEKNEIKEIISKYRKEFCINNLGVFIPPILNKETYKECTFEVYNIIEWSIKNPYEKELFERYKKEYSKYKGVNLYESYKKINNHLMEVSKSLDNLKNEINLIRISTVFNGNNIFKYCTIVNELKNKKLIDKNLNMNLVVKETCDFSNIKIITKENPNFEFVELIQKKYLLLEKSIILN